MKIAFLGTPEFALPSLKMLYDEKHELCVFTQPDKPKGRHGGFAASPVKEFALEHGIEVFQPEKIRSPQGAALLKKFAPELMITAAFGQILSAENLEIPKYGCINVHGSLLPKYRGASPIQSAIINGETKTGITIMRTDTGMDTGDMLYKTEIDILPDETYGELSLRLSFAGADALKTALDMLKAGALTPQKQDEAEATVCKMLTKEDGRLDFNNTALSLHNRVRGTNPWPGAYCYYEGEPLKIWKTAVHPGGGKNPGRCLVADPKGGLRIETKEGLLEILELQFSGSKRMTAKACLNSRSMLGKVLS